MNQITEINVKSAIEITKEELIKLRDSISIVKITRDKEYKEAIEVRKVLKGKRIEIQKQSKAFNDKLNTAKKDIKGIEIELTSIITPLEEEQDEQIKAFEAEREAKRLAKIEAEKSRVRLIRETLDGFRAEMNAKINDSNLDNIDTVIAELNDYDFDAQEFKGELSSYIAQSVSMLETKKPILVAQKEQAEKERIEAEKKQFNESILSKQKDNCMNYLASAKTPNAIKEGIKAVEGLKSDKLDFEFLGAFDSQKEHLLATFQKQLNYIIEDEQKAKEAKLKAKEEALLRKEQEALDLARKQAEEQEAETQRMLAKIKDNQAKALKKIADAEESMRLKKEAIEKEKADLVIKNHPPVNVDVVESETVTITKDVFTRLMLIKDWCKTLTDFGVDNWDGGYQEALDSFSETHPEVSPWKLFDND